jgi:hypothetical protein
MTTEGAGTKVPVPQTRLAPKSDLNLCARHLRMTGAVSCNQIRASKGAKRAGFNAVHRWLIGTNGRCSIKYSDGGTTCFVSSVCF